MCMLEEPIFAFEDDEDIDNTGRPNDEFYTLKQSSDNYSCMPEPSVTIPNRGVIGSIVTALRNAYYSYPPSALVKDTVLQIGAEILGIDEEKMCEIIENE